jgi:hypothetical protein
VFSEPADDRIKINVVVRVDNEKRHVERKGLRFGGYPGDNGREEVRIKHVAMDGMAFTDPDSVLKPPPGLLDPYRAAQLNQGQRQGVKPRDVTVRSPVCV